MNIREQDLPFKELPITFPDLARLRLNINTEWNSRKPGHRTLIRKELIHYWTHYSPSNLSQKEIEDIENLDNAPIHPADHVSISHCRSCGGFAIMPKPYRVGLDLEEVSRVRQTHLERIQNEWDEIPELALQHPHIPTIIWTAKESAFKALHKDLNLQVISEVSISQIQFHSPQLLTWKMIHPIPSTRQQPKHSVGELHLGFIYIENGTLLSIYLHKWNELK